MKIVVTGTRGIPSILGGIETHCEELYPRIASYGHDVTVIRRRPYVTAENSNRLYKGVRLHDIYAPRIKSLETVVHTFLAIIAARRMHPDILHIHAIGPSIMTPLARLFGMKVVITYHAPDYEIDRWGFIAKSVLKTGEYMGVHFAHKIIAISDTILKLLHRKYGYDETALIYNGVTKNTPSASTAYIDSLGIAPQKYILTAGRFVPEKNFHHLIEAFTQSGLYDNGYRLVIAGCSCHPDKYSEYLERMAKESGVILPGFIKGEKLSQLFTHAALFVLPSANEGLPITLLEAMDFGLDVLVSDIPANSIKQLSPDDFFKVGDIKDLSERIVHKISKRQFSRNYDLSDYDWDNIARQTISLYRTVQQM